MIVYLFHDVPQGHPMESLQTQTFTSDSSTSLRFETETVGTGFEKVVRNGQPFGFSVAIIMAEFIVIDVLTL